MKVKRLRDSRGFVGRRYGRFRVRDIRGRNVMVMSMSYVMFMYKVYCGDDG
jgi:hypothetical protein